MNFVAVHAGARDDYQLPWALAEGGLLECFVTDAFGHLHGNEIIPQLVRSMDSAGLRHCAGIAGARIVNDPQGFAWFAMEYLTGRVFKTGKLTNFAQAGKDRALSLRALREADQSGAKLFATSYYAGHAFRRMAPRDQTGLLFQIHPAPLVVKRLLEEEMSLQPMARASLMAEKELALSDGDLEYLADEPRLAERVLVASAFTKDTLVQQGIDPSRVTICPYGVDFARFSQRSEIPDGRGPLRLIWLGSAVQRKGLTYLLAALASFSPERVRLVICTRTCPDRGIFEHFSLPHVEVKMGLTDQEVVSEMQQSDLFVLPSIAEGFGHAIAQAMAVGLPVLATVHTMAADCVEEGVEGFVIPIRSVEAIREKIVRALDCRDDLPVMGLRAARRIREFTWERFRQGVREFARGGTKLDAGLD